MLALLGPVVSQTKEKLTVISPYFVPGEKGTEAFVRVAKNGDGVRILTNSLAANDVAMVYGGYSEWRKPLLNGGVQLWELKPTRGITVKSSMFGSSGASLHTKALTVDGRLTFVGSYNLDPRSTSLNCEQGVFVDDPVIASQLETIFTTESSSARAWQVTLRTEDPVERRHNNARQCAGRLDGTQVPGLVRPRVPGQLAALTAPAGPIHRRGHVDYNPALAYRGSPWSNIVPRLQRPPACSLPRVPSLAAGPDAIPAEVRELQRKALDDRRAYDTLRDLTERVGNRLAGSAGDARAVEWALATLRAQGFQNVRAEPVTVPRWIRGDASVQLVGTPDQDLTALALGGSVGTDGRAVEGDVVAATTVSELKRLTREAVAGRIVFLYQRMLETRNGMDYGPTVDNRVDGAIEAAKLGALAVVIRAVGSDDADRPHTGSLHYADGVPRIPAFSIGNAGADRLMDRIALGPVRLRLSSTSRCEGTAQSANVIGEIPGRGAASDPASEEFVVLGAHLDSWDVGTGRAGRRRGRGHGDRGRAPRSPK